MMTKSNALGVPPHSPIPQVGTNVKLIVEPPSETELVDLYMATFLKDFTGEWNLG